MNYKMIVYKYLHLLGMNICLQYLNMLHNNGHKKNNMYIHTWICSCKQVILHRKSCKYIIHKYVYRIKTYHEWAKKPIVQELCAKYEIFYFCTIWHIMPVVRKTVCQKEEYIYNDICLY